MRDPVDRQLILDKKIALFLSRRCVSLGIKGMNQFKLRMKRKIAVIIVLIIAIVAAAFWWFLAKPMNANLAVERYVKDVRKQPGKAVAALMPFPSYQAVPYSAEKSRSPFKPKIILLDMKIEGGPDLNRRRGELEAFSLDSLRMVGVISQDNRTWAIIQAPNDAVYRVHQGDFLGKNYGEIIEVLPDKIKISEFVSDGAGAWQRRPAILILSEK